MKKRARKAESKKRSTKVKTISFEDVWKYSRFKSQKEFLAYIEAQKDAANIFVLPKHFRAGNAPIEKLVEQSMERLQHGALYRERGKQMTGKRVSPERIALYRELSEILLEQDARGEERNISQAARILGKRHRLSQAEEERLARAYRRIQRKV